MRIYLFLLVLGLFKKIFFSFIVERGIVVIGGRDREDEDDENEEDRGRIYFYYKIL